MKQKKKKQKFKPLSSATPEERYRAMELATYWVTHVGACSVSLVGKIQSAEWGKLT